MIPGIDRGVPIFLLFLANVDIVRFCLGGGGAVGGQFGIIYFNSFGYVYVRCLGYVYVYVYVSCLGYVYVRTFKVFV